MIHLIREAKGEPEGALVLNHGRGTSEHDLFGLLDVLDPDQRLLGITTGAPLTGIPPGGRHWYRVREVGYPDPESFHAAYRELGEFMDGLLDQHGLDYSDTVIGGFSMGAVMSFAVGLGPDRPVPGGILALSGFIPTVEGWEPDLAGRAGLPVLIHHGSADPIIGVEFAHAARSVLSESEVDLTYIESGAAHSIPPEVIPKLTEFVTASTSRG